jgi:hypothetical protein
VERKHEREEGKIFEKLSLVEFAARNFKLWDLNWKLMQKLIF